MFALTHPFLPAFQLTHHLIVFAKLLITFFPQRVVLLMLLKPLHDHALHSLRLHLMPLLGPHTELLKFLPEQQSHAVISVLLLDDDAQLLPLTLP